MAKIAFLVLFLVGLCRNGEAQVLYGSIVGNVNDSTESPVPGALVTIKNKETSQSRETATNEAGGFIFPDVASGTCDVRIATQGFTSIIRTRAHADSVVEGVGI